MALAIKEAKKAYKKNEVPVGCVIVKNDKVISKAHNLKEKRKSSIMHAEIIAIMRACKKVKNWHLNECEMYVTLEPCMMCTGAIIESRIKKVYYSAESPKFGYFHILNQKHQIECEKGMMDAESSFLLKEFFKAKRG